MKSDYIFEQFDYDYDFHCIETLWLLQCEYKLMDSLSTNLILDTCTLKKT